MSRIADDPKTNVMRILEQGNIAYTPHRFECTGAVSGHEAAALMGEDPEHVYKTLVTVGKSGSHFVFVLPVEAELDMKKAAKAVGEKAVELIRSKELMPLTGYVHGGCSPIGMKKQFVTAVHEDAALLNTIIFSAGRIGFQVELPADELQRILPFTYADITTR